MDLNDFSLAKAEDNRPVCENELESCVVSDEEEPV
jgi:hypothetical protein